MSRLRCATQGIVLIVIVVLFASCTKDAHESGVADESAGFESEPANRSSTEGFEKGFETTPGSGMWMIPAPEAATLVQDAKSLLEGVTLTVERKGRQVVGIRLADAPEDSLLLRRGWRIGDVLTKVNATPIPSEDALRSHIAENHDRFSLYRFELLRDGEVMHLNYRLAGDE